MGSKWGWNGQLRRNLFGWEQSQWSCFCSDLDCIKIRRSSMDALAWSFSPKGVFNMGSFCRAMDETTSIDRWLDKFSWQGLYSPKTGNFCLTASKRQIDSGRPFAQAWAGHQCQRPMFLL